MMQRHRDVFEALGVAIFASASIPVEASGAFCPSRSLLRSWVTQPNSSLPLR